LALDALEDIGVDELILGGDFMDFYSVNAHGKDPDIKLLLSDEITCGKKRLEELQKRFKRARRIYLEGNHEYRLARYISKVAPDLFGVYDLRLLLDLEKYGFEFIPYGPYQKYKVGGSQLIARHEPIGGGVHAAFQSVTKAGASIVSGHNHRIQEYQICNIKGEYLRGISSGCLCDKHHSVMQYVPNFHNWQLGFVVVTVLEDLFFAHNIPIINYHCEVGDTIYKG
jgi:hypothetical protein